VFKEFDESLPEFFVFSVSFPEIMRVINYAVYQGEVQENSKEIRLSISFTEKQIKDIREEFRIFSTRKNMQLSNRQKSLIKEMEIQLERKIKQELEIHGEDHDEELDKLMQGIGVM
jgi:hypothetical protein